MNDGRSRQSARGGAEVIGSKDLTAIFHSAQRFISVLVLDGVLERFRRLKGGVIELGAGWGSRYDPPLGSRRGYLGAFGTASGRVHAQAFRTGAVNSCASHPIRSRMWARSSASRRRSCTCFLPTTLMRKAGAIPSAGFRVPWQRRALRIATAFSPTTSTLCTPARRDVCRHAVTLADIAQVGVRPGHQLGGIYLLLCVLLWILQDKLIFHPRPLAAEPTHPAAAAVELVRPDAVLRGWTVNADSTGPLIVYFGGNAEEVSGHIAGFAERAATTVLFNYRGYGTSDGKPSEAALVPDCRGHHRVGEGTFPEPTAGAVRLEPRFGHCHFGRAGRAAGRGDPGKPIPQRGAHRAGDIPDLPDPLDAQASLPRLHRSAPHAANVECSPRRTTE